MKVETRKYWKSIYVKQDSTPVHEIPDEEVEQYFNLLVNCLGYKRHETDTQIFFDRRLNCNESEEIIFYK